MKFLALRSYLLTASKGPSQFTHNNDGWFSGTTHSLGTLSFSHFQQLLKVAETKSFSRTGHCTGRPYVCPVTEITHLHGAVVIKLGHTVWTCREAVPTTVAFVPVNDDDTILTPFAYSSGGTRFDAGRLTTVHTGQGEERSGDIWVAAIPNVNDSPPLYSRSYITHALACHFTGAALDTPICIKVETVLLCHYIYCLFVYYDR